MRLRDDMDYQRDTWLAYRDRTRAEDYARHHTERLTWARFAMWRERRGVERALRRCHLSARDTLVDLPCGTGILGDVLARFPARVIAADVSHEMMDLARNSYDPTKLGGFIQTDITGTCFRTGAFTGAVTIGLMHRLPSDIRRQAVAELARFARRFVIMSCSIDSHGQRMKRWLLRRLRSTYRPAPSPLRLAAMIEELRRHGLKVVTVFRVVPFLSAEVVLLLEKQSG